MNTIKDIIKDFKKNNTRGSIIRSAIMDKEFPFDVISKILKCKYKLSRIEGWNIANTLLDEYNLREPKKGNKKHKELYSRYAFYKRQYNLWLYSPNKSHYSKLCAEYKQKINQAQREYTELNKLYFKIRYSK